MRTIESTTLFDLIAQKKFNEESDSQMRFDYEVQTYKDIERKEIIGSAEPTYKGRRIQSFTLITYPTALKFKVVKESA